MVWRRFIALLLLFTALTLIVTYPQVTGIRTLVPFHSDPYFSMWRLGWIAFQIPHGWTGFFEANIFAPEPHTLAYSDAMLLPGLLLAPLFWLGLSAVTIYNLALLSAIVLSGVTAALLVRRLADSLAAGIAAGTIYAFAPYRFDHYVHLELQIVFWVPLALLVMHSTISQPRLKDAWLLGGLAAAQVLSCVYAGFFFAAYAAVVGPLLLLFGTATRRWRTLTLWLGAGALAVAITVPYAITYRRAEGIVGTRARESVSHYGATLWSYRATPPTNRLFGREGARPGANELYLFPGYLALTLAAVGLVAGRDRRRLAYAAGLLAAFELSRGLNGWLYPWLFDHVPVFQALRVPARVGIFVNLSLAILAGYGLSALLALTANRRARAAIVVTAVALMLTEYSSAPVLAVAPEVSRIDHWLARQPPSTVVELPLAPQMAGNSLDWLYMYEGIEHRQRMLNGYSGFVPGSYYAMRDAMAGFPDDRSMALLRERHVDLVVLRGEVYRADEWEPLIAAARARPELSLVTILPFNDRFQAVFSVNRAR